MGSTAARRFIHFLKLFVARLVILPLAIQCTAGSCTLYSLFLSLLFWFSDDKSVQLMWLRRHPLRLIYVEYLVSNDPSTFLAFGFVWLLVSSVWRSGMGAHAGAAQSHKNTANKDFQSIAQRHFHHSR